MKILYLGSETGTSAHRIAALRRLGHDVTSFDTDILLPQSKLLRKVHWETGGSLLPRQFTSDLLARFHAEPFDICWVDQGRYVSRRFLIESKKQTNCSIVNYNLEDPFGKRDRGAWQTFLRCVPLYDLLVVVRECNVKEAEDRGAKDVLRVFRSADEIAHVAPSKGASETGWINEVLFLGTWFPERGPFLSALANKGVPLSIYGNGWQRAPEWPRLKSFWKGPGTTTDLAYASLISRSKVCLGLVSSGNRDLHTTRSAEIPLLGSAFCAERTSEHLAMYKEDEEAVFWQGAEECAKKCQFLLDNESSRRMIAQQGHLRCISSGYLNENVLSSIISHLTERGHNSRRTLQLA